MSNQKKLGELIEWVDERNKGVISTNLLGINIDKYFMPSVANIIGTDLSSYKLIKKNQFACNPMHVGRDEKMPIALYMDEEASIVSPAYFVFQPKDLSMLNPEYLMLWFRREEFDRECWFHTDGSVRGGITWEEIMELSIPVPSIEEQNEIVSIYNNLENRIKTIRRINDNLEAQLRCIFNESFGDAIRSKEELPSGWNRSEAQKIFEITIGKTPPRERLDCFTTNPSDIKWVSISDMGSNGTYILDTTEKLTASAVKEFNVKIIPENTVIYSFKMTNGRTAITTDECCTNEAIAHFKTSNPSLTVYAYCYLSTFRFSDLGSTSSITEAVNSKIIKSMPFVMPPRELLDVYAEKVMPLFKRIKLNSIEIIELSNVASTLLSLLSH